MLARISLAVLIALAGTPADARTLAGERLEKWLGTEALAAPIEISIDGEKNRSPSEVAAYFQSRPENTTFLPADFLASKVSARQKKCALDLQSDIYALRVRPVELPHDLDWDEDPLGDRNWQLQLHRLNFIDCLMAGYIVTKDQWFPDRIKALVYDWSADNLGLSPRNPQMTWHDHAGPNRMMNIARAFEFLRRIGQLDERFAAFALRLIHIHARIIEGEKYLYSRNHNHGLMQSYRLFQIATAFPEFVDATKWKETARSRLRNEVSHAMTDSGVHKENSPMYHDGISTRVAQIVKSVGFESSVEMQNNALRFTTAMLRPDGTYPPLGDTATRRAPIADYPDFDRLTWAPYFEFARGEEGTEPPETEFFWPDAGYYIRRSDWTTNASHLVFKCGFLSTAHRHQDDGNILLYAFGEDWLIDSGMYGYPKKGSEERRLRQIVVRPESHNLTMPVKAKLQKKPTGSGLSMEGETILCRSPMFVGYDYERRLSASDSRLVIRDRMSGPATTYRTLFRVPGDKHIEIDEDAVTVWNAGRTRKMTITYPETATPRIASGPDADPPSIETVDYRKARAAQTIVFEHPEGTEMRADFIVTLD